MKLWLLYHKLIAAPLCKLNFYKCAECAINEGRTFENPRWREGVILSKED